MTEDFAVARCRMVDRQIARRGIHDAAILDAMRTVPREAFIPAGMRDAAYDDAPLPIAMGQTISQPWIVAHMLDLAGVHRGDKVLDVGAGSGYATAVAAQIAGHVHAIERHEALVRSAQRVLASLRCDNVSIHHGDGTRGWPGAAPYDAILVAAASPGVPPALKEQLAEGGRLVIPVGPDVWHQHLLRITRRNDHDFSEERLGAVRFVPLIADDRPGDKQAGTVESPFE